MAYIKREDVLKHKRKMSGSDFSGEFWDEAVLCEDICKIPTADVVEVVRCKDCINNPGYVRLKGMVWCRKFRGDVHPNGYCSYGERKGGEG